MVSGRVCPSTLVASLLSFVDESSASASPPMPLYSVYPLPLLFRTGRETALDYESDADERFSEREQGLCFVFTRFKKSQKGQGGKELRKRLPLRT